MSKKLFSYVFRALVAESGLSLNELARRCGVASATLWQWSVGKTSPKLDTLDIVLGELGYKVEVVKADASNQTNNTKTCEHIC